MTSQPLIASVCVDYLSHPLSTENLLVCYQQITRQIAHAPQSAKDAAISFQHQSQTLVELLGQYQNLAIPTTKERPAPVGCQSQLKRMQNALWRRSSQSSLAKDVALVHPETLNWPYHSPILNFFFVHACMCMTEYVDPRLHFPVFLHLSVSSFLVLMPHLMPLDRVCMHPTIMRYHVMHCQFLSWFALQDSSVFQKPFWDWAFSFSFHFICLFYYYILTKFLYLFICCFDALARRSRQKECDVLWLYGPLYEINYYHQQGHDHKNNEKGPGQGEWTFEQFEPRAPSNFKTQHPYSDQERVHFATQSLTKSSKLSDSESAAEISIIPTVPTSTSAEIETLSNAEDAASVETPKETLSAPADSSKQDSEAVSISATKDQCADTKSTAPSEEVALHTDLKDVNIVVPAAAGNTSSEASNALVRPTKSALKHHATRTQVFEELRAFVHSPHYIALTKSMTVAGVSPRRAIADGARSEPTSPVSTISSSFLLPIFPAPTKYHFRSHDRRRASFPKSASHPSHMNVNVNVNMSLTMQLNNDPFTSSKNKTSSSVVSKQLRFSLEVQELVFLPSSPPFRISRAKPTRAHSDPAIQTASCSSFIAPSHIPSTLPPSIHSAPAYYRQQYPPHSHHHYHHYHQQQQLQNQLHHGDGGLISTATASSPSSDNTTTAFIKVRAQDARVGPSSSSSTKASGTRLYLQHGDEDEYEDEGTHECEFNDGFHDDIMFGDDREGDDDEEEEEDDEFNGVGTGTHHHHRKSRRRFLTKDAIVARRVQSEDQRHRVQPGMLWQVYTAVTGVKELIAWYGSMVYHSSSL
ncbi:hypothetical protein BX616_000798 [Lobosporangium transversale]|nr:hypothetical protein BX616_000798 [Lobosporangium transversale]